MPMNRSKLRCAANQRAPTSRTVSQRPLRSTILQRRRDSRRPVWKGGRNLLAPTDAPEGVLDRQVPHETGHELLSFDRAMVLCDVSIGRLAKIETREMTPP